MPATISPIEARRIGAVGTAAMGILLLGESTDPMRLASIGLIVAGIVGLKLTSPV